MSLAKPKSKKSNITILKNEPMMNNPEQPERITPQVHDGASNAVLNTGQANLVQELDDMFSGDMTKSPNYGQLLSPDNQSPDVQPFQTHAEAEPGLKLKIVKIVEQADEEHSEPENELLKASNRIGSATSRYLSQNGAKVNDIILETEESDAEEKKSIEKRTSRRSTRRVSQRMADELSEMMEPDRLLLREDYLDE